LSSKGFRGSITLRAKINRQEKESRHSLVCDLIKFSEVEKLDLMRLRVASSGQFLPDYLAERGFVGTFTEQLEKIGATDGALMKCPSK
jgi:hypothetical protein